MFRKYFLVPAVLSLVSMFVLADAAHAQWRGGGGGGGRGGVNVGGVNIGWGNSGYGYRGGAYGPGYGSGMYGPGYGSGYGGNYRSGYYSSPSYYSYPSTSYYYAPSDYYPSPTYYPAAAQSQPSNAAQIRVFVPDAQARVWFDGSLTQQTGTDRLFHTPSLQGTNNTYRVRASWTQDGREMTQERVVNVEPGRMSTVDFTQQSSDPLPESTQPAPSPRTELITGRIVRTSQDQVVIDAGNSREVIVYTNPQTRYLVNQNPGTFTDLRVGGNVSVNFRMDGKRHIGNTIIVRP